MAVRRQKRKWIQASLFFGLFGGLCQLIVDKVLKFGFEFVYLFEFSWDFIKKRILWFEPFFYEERGEFDRAIFGIAGSPASLVMRTPELANAVADVLNEMLEDGTYEAIFDEWGVSKIFEWQNDVRARGTYGWNGKFEVY